MDYKLKNYKPTKDNWLNDVIPDDNFPYAHAMKEIDTLNDKGEVIGRECAKYDPFCPIKDDENKQVKDTSLTLDPENPAGYAATAALIAANSDVKANGVSPVGSGDADTMTIISQSILSQNEQ